MFGVVCSCLRNGIQDSICLKVLLRYTSYHEIGPLIRKTEIEKKNYDPDIVEIKQIAQYLQLYKILTMESLSIELGPLGYPLTLVKTISSTLNSRKAIAILEFFLSQKRIKKRRINNVVNVVVYKGNY